MATTTRIQLFRDVAQELGDKIELTATTTGTATTFIDTERMVYADGGLNGREAYYATAAGGSAANQSLRRIVTATAQASGTITLSPALPAAPLATDVLILVNGRGTGVTVPEIFDKINQLIRRVASELATEVADTPATFSATAPTINIPTA